MEENQRSRLEKGEIHHAEAIEEKVALSDRFGLWLSFTLLINNIILRLLTLGFSTMVLLRS